MAEEKNADNEIKQVCDDCGNDAFYVYVTEKPDINGFLRAYCKNCGKELEGTR